MQGDGPAIRAERLVKSFGEVRAVEGVDLEVARGSVLGLLGPNGAGKTTTVRILTTTLMPDSGRGSVLGHDVVRDAPAVRAVIGLAGQYAAVDEELTGRENLRMVGLLTHLPKSEIEPRAGELLGRFGLADAADRLVKTYSGGMRRRLDLAAALVHRPSVLFLDEPTTGLDPASRRDLWVVIEELVDDGTTLLLTTEYLEEADRLADLIAVIDQGRVIAEGSAGELKRKHGSTTVELGFDDGETALRAAALVGAATPCSVAGHCVSVRTTDAAHTIAQAVRELDNAALSVRSIEIREPTLDDVFLGLTGHEAAVVDPPGEAT